MTKQRKHSNTLNLPKVSVIITCYNYADYIVEAIRSVREQSYQDLECVVVDDLSTDGSAEIIERELEQADDDRFRLLRLKENVGQMGAFKRALPELNGVFVCFLDADDLWSPEFVRAHVLSHLNSSRSSGLSYADGIVVDANGEIQLGTWQDVTKDRPETFSGDPALNFITTMPEGFIKPFDPAIDVVEYKPHPSPAQWHFSPTSGCMFRLALIRELLPDQYDGKFYADYHFEMLASLLTGSICIHRPLFAYRMHNENLFSRNPIVGGQFLPGAWDNDLTTSRNALLLEFLDTKWEKLCRLYGSHNLERVARQIASVSEEQAALFKRQQPRLYRKAIGTDLGDSQRRTLWKYFQLR